VFATRRTSAPDPAYRLEELGWAQFERLCQEVVGAGDWRGRADRTRTVLSDEGLAVPGERRALPGPTLVAALWVRPWLRRRWTYAVPGLAEALAEERLAWPMRPPTGSVLVLVNVEPAAAELELVEDTVRAGLGGSVGIAVAGPAALGEVIDGAPKLRRRLPSVLGVRDLAGLIPSELVERSTTDFAAAVALSRVFVPTGAHARTLAVLARNRFAVLTGPPEMGKTAIARMVGLALLTEGWEVHDCIRPDELWNRFDRVRRQLFVVDDAFGSTEYRPEAAERWAVELDRVLRALDERHWLVWTSRPAPLNAGLRRIHREHGVERFPKPAEIEVAATDLDVEEKALILFRHAHAARLPAHSRSVVKAHGWSIVSHSHFTPERIRRFVSKRLRALPEGPSADELSATVDAEMREPTTAMATSFRALPGEHRALLVALLDAPPGPVPERQLAAAARRHADGGLPRAPAELVDRLTDHFVRVVPPTSVTWVHPSWRDLVIDELVSDLPRRRRFLERCSVNGILLAVSVAGGRVGERSFPLLVEDLDWDAAGDRLHGLVPELDDTDRHRLLAALGTAVEAAPAPRARREAEALAATVLDRLRALWNEGCRPAPAGLLTQWFLLSAELSEARPPPDVAATWIELAPTEPVFAGSDAAVRRFDEWLELVAALREHRPAELEGQFGFPDRYAEVVRQFVEDAASAAGQESSPALASCLRGLQRVAPEYAHGALRVAVGLEREAEPLAWAASKPHRNPPLPERSIVSRILSDLGSSG
jgi:hypothetical protein